MSRFPTARKLVKLAQLCEVTDQRTGERVQFDPLIEQIEIFNAASQHDHQIYLKGRQIGCSTAICFLDAVYAVMYPGSKIAVVADTEQKCHGLLDRVRDFFVSLAVKTEISNRSKIRLTNKSEVHALTANASKGQEQSKAGRSLSFQMLHLSELAFWPDQNAYGALSASAGLSAPIIIESTSSGPGDLMWHLWNTENDYRKVFFDIESHGAYKADGSSLSKERLDEGRELGFTDPDSMAWFFQTLENRFSGDLIKCLREYPQRPEHAFQTAEGRWIGITPGVLESNLVRGIDVFKPRDYKTGYSVGVDTAGGIGKDASSVVVLDKADGSIAASYYSYDDTIDKLADYIRVVYELYAPDHVCVETNGIGLATAQAAREKGVPVREVRTTDASRYSGLLLVKNAVEAGILAGPLELAEECDDLHIDKRERFAGRKDLCMALGFALEDIKRSPLFLNVPEKKDVFKLEKFMRKNRGWSGGT
jgi:hypothetical protein